MTQTPLQFAIQYLEAELDIIHSLSDGHFVNMKMVRQIRNTIEYLQSLLPYEREFNEMVWYESRVSTCVPFSDFYKAYEK